MMDPYAQSLGHVEFVQYLARADIFENTYIYIQTSHAFIRIHFIRPFTWLLVLCTYLNDKSMLSSSSYLPVQTSKSILIFKYYCTYHNICTLSIPWNILSLYNHLSMIMSITIHSPLASCVSCLFIENNKKNEIILYSLRPYHACNYCVRMSIRCLIFIRLKIIILLFVSL